ncbi:MAG: uracil-DNA glycosylase, partial [Mangrovicoccus sp.]|nr:uracil-DNA glycosylase [Mangrovicoccus sp.]
MGEISREAALAALAWQQELGADEAIGAEPVDRFALAEAPKAAPAQPGAAPVSARIAEDPVEVATAAAEAAGSLEDLREAMARFEHCELRHGARSVVFADGQPRARVMIIGEAPGRDEDMQGKPFVGRAGALLDRMLAAIGMGRDAPDAEKAVYITNVLPWRPPQNRDPKPDEIAMLMPFLRA